MLLQGAAVVRFANTFLNAFKTKHFVLVAIYVRENGRATRYCLFQRQNGRAVPVCHGGCALFISELALAG